MQSSHRFSLILNLKMTLSVSVRASTARRRENNEKECKQPCLLSADMGEIFLKSRIQGEFGDALLPGLDRFVRLSGGLVLLA